MNTSRSIAQDLVDLSRRIRVTAANGFAIAGGEVVLIEEPTEVEQALATAIYDQCYLRSSGVRDGGMHDDRGSDELVDRYSRANGGIGTFEPGWRLMRMEQGERCVVSKHGVEFWTAKQWIASDGPEIAPGAPIRVAVPKELRELFFGYYLFVGNAPATPDGGPGTLARFYFHVTELGAVRFVETVSRIFNDAGTPFRAKILNQSGRFFRADSAVLYIDREGVDETLPLVRSVHDALDGFLREPIPMFTLRLAHGLGVADDTGSSNESFGQNRSVVVARGLLGSFFGRPPTEDERLAGIVRAFENAGLSVMNPHLHRATAKPYPSFADSLGQR